MIEQLEKIDKIYDLLALCSSYILNELKEKTYEFATFDDEAYEDVDMAIERYCQEKEENGCKIAFEELKKYVRKYFQTDINIERCYALVKYIDESVEIEINDKLIGGRGIVCYSSLNTQYKDKVRLFPKRVESITMRGNRWFQEITDMSGHSLFRKSRECASSKLDEETSNYMIWDENRLKRFPLNIYHINEKNPIFKHFIDREKLQFGIVPLTNRSLGELLEVKYQKRAFYIESMKKDAEKEILERYKAILKKVSKEDVDFLIFPEMLITEEIVKSIDNKEDSPKIVVNGSIWKDYKNKTIVTDGKGNEIFNYLKKEPFKYKQKGIEYKEYLDCEYNGDFSILEIEGIGRIGIAICKDLINDEIKMFHKYIGTNILIVPAYTNSMDLQSAAEELSKDYQCIVIVANSCSALAKKGENKEKERVGFITLPAKSGTDRANIIKMYYKDECVGECDCKCCGKFFVIDFYNTKRYESMISYEIIEK